MARKSSLVKKLPKKTKSLCPECIKLIEATIFEENGKVMIEKTCKEHGTFKDVYWSDVNMYLIAEAFANDGKGVSNPKKTNKKGCPFECGLCDQHLSHTVLALVDLTNRCNLKCPICFANANATGYVYEPSYEQIVEMMKVVRANKPVPAPSIQFSGGEPTLHPDFFKILSKARDFGFSQIQIATNGIALGSDPAFAKKCSEAGLHTAYLQFDGLTDEVYKKARGKNLLKLKLQVIENCRKVKPHPLSIVLVPTIVNTINDDQVGDIVKFALKNLDVVRGVNFQPVSFSGRISQEERNKQRFTLPDLVDRLEKQTDFIKRNDFYAVPCVTPLSELAELLTGVPKPSFTVHPHCGIATYLIVDNGNVVPITRFVNVDGLFTRMDELTEKFGTTGMKVLLNIGKKVDKLKSKESRKRDLEKLLEKYFGEFFYRDKMPKGFDIQKYIVEVLTHGDKDSMREFAWKSLMIGGMHFQDGYNYDVERTKRCVIHYATPDGDIIPFCSYNCGPSYRESVEKKHSIPLKEWKEKKNVKE